MKHFGRSQPKDTSPSKDLNLKIIEHFFPPSPYQSLQKSLQCNKGLELKDLEGYDSVLEGLLVETQRQQRKQKFYRYLIPLTQNKHQNYSEMTEIVEFSDEKCKLTIINLLRLQWKK